MKQYTNGNNLVKLGVIVADFLIMNLFLLGFIKWGGENFVPQYILAAKRITLFVANMAMILSEYLFHSKVHERKVENRRVVLRAFWLTFAHVGLLFVTLRILHQNGGNFSRFMLYFGAAECVILIASRMIEVSVVRYLRGLGMNTRSVLFVGSDPALVTLYERLVLTPSMGYHILGYCASVEMEDYPSGLKFLGTIEDLNARIDAEEEIWDVGRIDELFCSMSHDEAEEIVRIMRFCDRNMVRFFYVPRMFGNYQLNLKPEHFGDISVYTNHVEPLTLLSNRVVKRLFDICVSLLVCILLLPFIPVIALIIRLQSAGPTFFAQDRTGMNGRPFKCLKFRTMHVNEQSDRLQATEDDPRKFAFGSFMRRTNLDEFPQFLNVLMGDMSIVGPRPHMLYHTSVYGRLIDKYMVRHFCKPGITGLSQVSGFRGETRELWQMEERVKRDLWYIENWSFWLDIRIMLRTAWTIFVRDGKAY